MQTISNLHLAFSTTVNWRTDRGSSPINLDVKLECQSANSRPPAKAIRAACIEHIRHLFYWNHDELVFTREDSKLTLTKGLDIPKLVFNLPDIQSVHKITIEIPVSQEVIRFAGTSKDGMMYEAEVLALTQAQTDADAEDIQTLHAELDERRTRFITDWNDLTLKNITDPFSNGNRQGAFDRGLDICSKDSDFGISYGSITVLKFESRMSHSTQQKLVDDFKARGDTYDLCWLLAGICGIGLTGGLAIGFVIWMFRLHAGWYPKRSIGGLCHRSIMAVLRDDIGLSAKDSMDIAACRLYSENLPMKATVIVFPMILVSAVLIPFAYLLGPIVCSLLGNIAETVFLTIIVGPIMGFGPMNSMSTINIHTA